jgi:hypothetical protein
MGDCVHCDEIDRNTHECYKLARPLFRIDWLPVAGFFATMATDTPTINHGQRTVRIRNEKWHRCERVRRFKDTSNGTLTMLPQVFWDGVPQLCRPLVAI